MSKKSLISVSATKSPIDRKFWTDTCSNYLSLGMQAAIGVALNFIIVAKMGASALGVFNQIYAVYVIAGQFVVWGLHDSAQKHVAEFMEHLEEKHSLTLAAVFLVFFIGLCGAATLALLSGVLGEWFHSAEVGKGLLFVSPGLFLFVINKVLMGILNGNRRMIAFAMGQSVRAIGILIISLYFIWTDQPPSFFGLSFTLAEVLLLVFLLGGIRPLEHRPFQISAVQRWMMRHAHFGSRAVVHGCLSESFLRIDILMLGLFVSDQMVGVYSFVGLFVEGVYQIAIVFRNIANPILVRLLSAKDKLSIAYFSRKTALYSFVTTLLMAGLVVLVFPYLGFIVPLEILEEGYGVLLILMVALVVYSTCVPFDYIFLDAGRPATQSLFMTMNTLTNVIFNYLLIPYYGLYGAGLATAFSFLFSCASLNLFSSKILDLRGGIFLSR